MPHKEVPDAATAPTTCRSIAAGKLYQRLMPRLPELTDQVLRHIVSDVPQYRRLPSEQLSGDIRRTVERGIALFATSFVDGKLPDDKQLAELRSSAALRAEEGIPLDTVIGVYHIAAKVVWDAVMLGVDDVQIVLEVHEHVMRFMHAVVPAAAAGYVDARWTELGEEHNDRQLLLASLLEGGTPASLSTASTAALAASYVVFSLRIGPHPDEGRPGVDTDVAARRKIRRLRAEAEHFARGPVLSTLDTTAGLLLVPHPKQAAELTGRDWSELQALTARMSKVAGADVTAGAHASSPDGLADAARIAHEVLAVVTALRRPAGFYRLSDVLFEYQLSRPGPARDGLIVKLEPISAKQDLLDTVRAYLEHACNRRKAAHALHVHPNTVDYRLTKIAELTGLSPADPDDVRLLAAAFAAKTIAQG